MPAGVHHARGAAFVRQVVRLLDRQRVHVRAQADPPLPVAAAQHPHHARLAHAAVHLDPQPFQRRRHAVRRAVLLQPQFRMRVQVLAEGGKLALIAADVVDGGHARLPGNAPPVLQQGGRPATPRYPR